MSNFFAGGSRHPSDLSRSIESQRGAPARNASDRDTAHRRRGSSEQPVSRYDRRTHNTRHPAAGLPSAPLKSFDTTTAAIVDPMGDGKERLYATVNRRVDILEQERSHGRISEAAYQTGRFMQAVFERSGRVGGTNWAGASRRDPREVQSETIARVIDNARQINELLERVRGRVGERNLRILRRIIGDRASFAECAAFEGKSTGPRGQAFIAETFRFALEDAVAAVQQSKGKVQPTPDDKHAAAAETMYELQEASVQRAAAAKAKA